MPAPFSWIPGDRSGLTGSSIAEVHQRLDIQVQESHWLADKQNCSASVGPSPAPIFRGLRPLTPMHQGLSPQPCWGLPLSDNLLFPFRILDLPLDTHNHYSQCLHDNSSGQPLVLAFRSYELRNLKQMLTVVIDNTDH